MTIDDVEKVIRIGLDKDETNLENAYQLLYDMDTKTPDARYWVELEERRNRLKNSIAQKEQAELALKFVIECKKYLKEKNPMSITEWTYHPQFWDTITYNPDDAILSIYTYMKEVLPTPTAATATAVHNPVPLYDGLTASKELMSVAHVYYNDYSIIADERVIVASLDGKTIISVLYPLDFYLNFQRGFRRMYAEFMAKKLPPGRTLEGVTDHDLYHDVVTVFVAHSYDDLLDMLLQLIIGPKYLVNMLVRLISAEN